MRTSVIIPNYNYGHYLTFAIDSVLNQTEPVDEIIVVDDGSTDSSKDVLERYGDKITAIFQPNAGQASAFNAGIKAASGDIVFLLDADDVFNSDKVQTIKKLFAEHQEMGWVFHELKHISEDELKASEDTASGIIKPDYDIIDKQKMMRKGKLDYIVPATSGLCFNKKLANIIFPLPVAESIYISDHYIKFLALSESKGIHVGTALGKQLIHNDNLYTGKTNHTKKARLFINTAYHLKQKRPSISTFCNNIYTEGLTSYAKSGEKNSDLDDLIAKYDATMNFVQKVKTSLKYRIKKAG